ncbi:MAG TPA: hypothetical protein VNE83_04395 [Terriglobales bacterium]|nr:hypothetical protein [Terriglobales bacterium]
MQVVEELEGFGAALLGPLDGLSLAPSFSCNRVVVQNDGPLLVRY